jgi:hypothetical protein
MHKVFLALHNHQHAAINTCVLPQVVPRLIQEKMFWSRKKFMFSNPSDNHIFFEKGQSLKQCKMLSGHVEQRGQVSMFNMPRLCSIILVGRELWQAVQQKNLYFSGAGSLHSHFQEGGSSLKPVVVKFLIQEYPALAE